LKAAVEKTLAADGFHIEGSVALEGETIESEGDYVAPDRFFMASAEGTPGAATTIIVGRKHYVSEPDDLNTFSLWERPCDVGVDTFIPALEIVGHAEDIERDGDAFTFRADGDDIEGEARVDGDYLVELAVRYSLLHIDEPVEERWVFSNFGTTAFIEPPPDERVLEESRFDENPPIVTRTGQPPSCS
jgi:hypothetical protein